MKPISERLVNNSAENQSGEETNIKDKYPKKAFKRISPEQRTKRETLNKTLIWLCETFPQCFNLSSPKPLKRHIEADIFLQLPKDGSISRRSIRFILAFYVKRGAYYRSLLENSYRFNLDGLATEEVEFSHKEYAKTVLEQKRFRNAL